MLFRSPKGFLNGILMLLIFDTNSIFLSIKKYSLTHKKLFYLGGRAFSQPEGLFEWDIDAFVNKLLINLLLIAVYWEYTTSNRKAPNSSVQSTICRSDSEALQATRGIIKCRNKLHRLTNCDPVIVFCLTSFRKAISGFAKLLSRKGCVD